MAKASRNQLRKRRHLRVRTKIEGTSERPRLNVFRSLNHIYAQLVNDEQGETLVAASSLELEGNGDLTKAQAAEKVGELIAERAVDQGVKKIIFDRGGYRYHGRVKALAEAARKGGLEF